MNKPLCNSAGGSLSVTRPTSHVSPWHTDTVRIIDVINEATGVATYRMKIEPHQAATSYQFVPGQFNMLYVPGVGESAISMSGNPCHADSWVHTIRVAGNVTRTIASLKPGDTLGVRGPFGTGWPIEDLVGNNVLIVAGGLGLAPLRPLIYRIIGHRSQYGQVWLVCGARNSDGLLFRNEYESWARAGIEVHSTVDMPSPDWNGHVGVVTLLIDRLQIPEPSKTHLVTCGPEVMMKYAASSGMRRGIAPDRTWVSLERNMQCAVGLCGHCQLGPEFICKDGPVLRFDRVHHLLLVEQL